MAFDEGVAERVRESIGPRPLAEERKMFGGIAFLLGGHMAVGVIGRELMVRVGADAYEDALAQPHARLMDFTGRPLRGFVYVAPPGFRTDSDLDAWVRRGLDSWYDWDCDLPPRGVYAELDRLLAATVSEPDYSGGAGGG